MGHKQYIRLEHLILGVEPSAAIEQMPLFQELATTMPREIAWLCVTSQTVERSDLLPHIALSLEDLQATLLWMAHDTKPIAECNRGVLHYFIARMSDSFLRMRHPEFSGLTLGARFILSNVLWAADMLTKRGINPFYDNEGLCIAVERVYAIGKNLPEVCRYALANTCIDPAKEDFFYPLVHVHCYHALMLDILSVIDVLHGLEMGVRDATRRDAFSLLSRSSLRAQHFLPFTLAIQHIAQGHPHVVDYTRKGQDVLEQSPTVNDAFLTYVRHDRLWQKPHTQSYITDKHLALLHLMEKYYYPDLVQLVQGYENADEPSLMALVGNETMQPLPAEHVNDWITVYGNMRACFDLGPDEDALFEYLLAEFERASHWMEVSEGLWLAAIEDAKKQTHLWKNSVQEKYEACKTRIEAHALYKYGEEGVVYKAVAQELARKMNVFLQQRPPMLAGTAFIGAMAQWLSDNPATRARVASQLQEKLLNGGDRSMAIPAPVEKVEISPETLAAAIEAVEAIEAAGGWPISTRLYTEDALARYKVYVDEQPSRVQNAAFYKRLGREKLHDKSLARSKGAIPKVQALRSTFLHFSEVIDHVENHLYLCDKGSGAFYIPPVLIVGGPGIGKTFFLHELARAVNTPFEMIGMEGVTSGFDITGLTEGYSSGAPGRLLTCLVTSPSMNPIVLLDEIDKAGGDSRYPVVNRLLPLLERYTAQKYKDECLPLEVDASHIVWFATANDEKALSGPIKSRFDTFNVPAPNAMQKDALTQGVYLRIVESNPWGAHLDKTLSEDVLYALARASTPGAARDIRRIFTTACSRALREDASSISVAHLGLPSFTVLPWDAEPRLPTIPSPTSIARIS